MRRVLMAAIVLVAGCGDDAGGSEFCFPQGRVVVGAAGTAGNPLPNFADCYAGSSPVLSLGSAREAMALGNELDFTDQGLTAQVDGETCRVTIRYEFESMLSDGTPNTGVSTFEASPDPDDRGSWSVDPVGAHELEWTNEMGNTNVCGNQIDDVVIAVE